MGWTGVKTQIKLDFFRLLTLMIVIMFLGFTLARMSNYNVDDTIYDAITTITIAILPSSSLKESAELVGNNRKNNFDERV